ncbi:zinc metalloprotease [Parasphingopyxis sp. CP4]|uniref:KPN_02809 family neutral zinc metallopeptidase n=1 Tax=Parasphingopyxis sp. CP4 TaxID=2724527 RepID=UPI0015A35468|nr:neutral zinc metallopeptidase [Parasphingopyxis sp. CP4]QLC22896.1 zinc metalloprotease [Parasphingopyxis sp. CP4]
MRLDDLDPSRNTRDHGRGGGRSGRGMGGGGLGGLLGLLPMLLGRRMGLGTLIIIAIIGYFLFSGGGLQLGEVAPGPATEQSAGAQQACDTEAELFACRVLTSTEQTWTGLFRQNGSQYDPPTLHFYQAGTRSGCGAAQASMGPFYCPADQGIYLDTSFFQQMESDMGAGGDFAQAYVIAHEVGHHIQYITGRAREVRSQQQRVSSEEGNALQVRMELEADCYAGVWAARNRNRMEPGDMEEGMRAANAIGDDTLQRQAQGYTVPESFTHGTSEQRMRWLRRGLEQGDPSACDTFSANRL